MTLSTLDLGHLRRCVDLALEALEDGDDPFGSVLVDADGQVRREERNAVGGGDQTRHPELALARWAAEHLEPRERRDACVYTSAEHCPMCAAAHGWVGLGRIVYAVSSAQLSGWLSDWGAPAGPVRTLPVDDLVPGILLDGPAPTLLEEVRALHRRRFEWLTS
ncbi:MAG: nucleoside deaminase [Nocardioides sp.]|nr:nucleoside deaminase [Nocardioides sp.]